MSFAELQNYYERLLKEAITKADDLEDALKQAKEEGHEKDDAHSRATEIMEAIKRKNEYKDDMEDLKKATYARRDTFALASWLVSKLHGITEFGKDSLGQKLRNWYAEKIDKKHGPGSKGSKESYYQPQQAPKKTDGKKDDKLTKAQPLQKLDSSLANLMSAAAGWAFSGDVGRAGQPTDAQAREWERTLSAAERRAAERAMRSRMRRKSKDTSNEALTQLKTFYDDSDTYIKRTPNKNGVSVQKEHSMSPPRAGEVWDAVKHRWVKPENIGHSVSEVQGKKRIRGTGAGVHERSVAGHGSGKARLVEAGRRFKGTADAGAGRPHQTSAHASLHRQRRK